MEYTHKMREKQRERKSEREQQMSRSWKSGYVRVGLLRMRFTKQLTREFLGEAFSSFAKSNTERKRERESQRAYYVELNKDSGCSLS